MRKIMLLLTSVLLTLVTSIAFSALSTSLAITSEVKFRFIADIRINSVSFVSASNGAQIGYESDFSKNTVSNGFILPNSGSSISYKVHVDNSGDVDYSIYNILRQSSDNGVNVSVSGYNVQDVIPAKTSVDLILTYTTTNPSESVINVVETFDYRKVYHVTYETGTSVIIPAQVKYEGVNLTLTSQEPTRGGYTFTKWNTESDGTGTNYNAGSTYVLDEDVTLYAQYVLNNYNITYALNNGTVATANPTTYSYTDPAITLNNPTKTLIFKGNPNATSGANAASGTVTIGSNTTQAQTFAGWSGTGITGNSTNVTIPTGSTGDRSYTAHWTAVAPAKLPKVEKTGYTCGWSTTSTGKTIEYESEATNYPTSKITEGQAATVNLYAVCNPNTYELTINPNGGTYDGKTTNSTKTMTYDSNNNNDIGVPTRSGYTFDGWYLAANSKASQLFDNTGKNTNLSGYFSAAYSTGVWKKDGVATVYAHWSKAVSATTNSVSPTSYIYDGTAKTPTPTVKDGSTPLTNNTDYSVAYTNNTNVGTATATITGKNVYNATTKAYYTGTATVNFAINNAKLTFDKGSCVSTSGTTTLYTRKNATAVYTGVQNTTAGTIPTASKTGYTFNGWYTASTGGSKVLNANGTFTGTAVTNYTNTNSWQTVANQTLYAQCSPNTYTVTANANGGTIASTTGWSGTGSTSTKSVTYDSAYGTLPTVSKSGYTFKGWSLLPQGYKQVEYIQSTGTQYIDTGAQIFNKDSHEIVMDMTPTEFYNYNQLFGSTHDGDTFEAWIYSTGNLNGRYNGAYYGSQNALTVNTRYLISHSKQGANLYKFVDGTLVSGGATNATTSTTTATLILFKSGSDYSKFKLYASKIYANGELVRNLIPCINESTGKAGLYDLVTNTFYGNAATSGNDFTVPSTETYITSSTIVTTASNHNIYAHYSINNPATPTITGGATKVYGSSATTLTCSTSTNYVSGTSKYYSFGYATSDGGTPSNWTTASTTATLNIAANEYVGQRWYSCRVYASDGSQTTSTVASATTADTEMTINNAKITWDANSCGTISGTSPAYVRKGTTGVYTGIRNTTAGTIASVSKAGYTFNGWYDGTTKVINADGTIVASVSNWTDSSKKWLITADKTLKASCTPNIYSVTLDNQGATTAGTTKYYYQYKTTKVVDGVTCYYYTDSALTTCLSGGYNITKPAKTGYTFGGYYTAIGGSGTQYVNASGGGVNNIYQKLPSEINSSYTTDIPLYAKWTINNPATPTITGGATKVYGSSATTLTCSTATNYVSGTSKYYSFGYATSDGGTPSNWTTASTTNTLSIAANEYVGQRWYSCRVYASDGDQTTSTVASATTADTEMTINNAKITWDANSCGTISGTSPAYVRKSQTGVFTEIRNSTAGTIASVSKSGYTFNGWYDGTTKVINADGTIVASVSNWTDSSKKWLITADKTLKASCTKNSYTITYALNNGTNNGNNPSTYTVESSAITLAAPTKTLTFKGNPNATSGANAASGTVTIGSNTTQSQTFAGWSGTGITGNSTNVTIPTGSTGDRSYTAHWTAVAPAKLPKVEKTGYTCGWSTTSTGKTIEYESEATNYPTSKITEGQAATVNLYAVCNPNTYELTINPNGGTYDGKTTNSTKTMTYDSNNNNDIGVPTRSGYTFDGWYLAANSKTSQLFDNTGKNTNLSGYFSAAYSTGVWKRDGVATVYAHWSKAVSATTNSVSPTSYIYDGTAKTPTPTVKDGSTTLTNNTDYSVAYTNNTNVGTATATITGKNVYNTTTKAYYTGTATVNFAINNAKLTFDKGSCDTTSGTTTLYTKKGATGVYTGVQNTTAGTIPTASKTGYTFNGWYTASTGGSKVLNANRSFTGTAVTGYVTTNAWDVTADKTLYAQCSPATYTVTANANGGSISSTTGWTGTGNTATKSVTYESAYGTLPTVSKSGYTFGGWSYGTVFTGKTSSAWVEPFIGSSTLTSKLTAGKSYKVEYDITLNEAIPSGYEASQTGQWGNLGIRTGSSNYQYVFVSGGALYPLSGANYTVGTKYHISGTITTPSDLSTAVMVFYTARSTQKGTSTGYVINGTISGLVFYENTDTYGNINSSTIVKVASNHEIKANWSINNPATPTITGGETKVYGAKATTLTCSTATNYTGATKYYSFGYATSNGGTPSNWTTASTTATLNIAADAYVGQRWYSCRVYASDGSQTTSTVASATTADTEMTINNAKITWDANSCGTISGTSPAYVRKSQTGVFTGIRNSTAGTIASVSKAGWTFNGWYDGTTKVINGDGTIVASVSNWTDSSKKWLITADKTLKASCTINGYTVTYNTTENGGTGTIASQTIAYGSSIPLPTTGASKSGWTFVGWNTDKNATTALSSLTMGTDDVILYAIYRKEAVTLTADWHANGATLSSTAQSTCTLAAVYNNATQATSCTVTAPTITRANYDIVGWNQSATATTNDSNYNTSTGKLTLTSSNTGKTWYAITKAQVALTATFANNNGATVASTTATCYLYGASESCQVTAPTVTAQTGFNHIGFNMNQNATSNSSSYNTSTNKLTITGNSTWYPITKSASQYTGTFNIQDSNAATKSGGTLSCYRYNGATNCNIIAPKLTAKSGYTVVGWDKTATSTTAAYASEANISINANTTFYSITYYNTTVTITFNRNTTNAKVVSQTPKGGTASTDATVTSSCTKMNGATTCSITSPKMTVLTGYHAVGYATSASATSSSWNQDTAKTVSTSTTYYAITAGNSYTIKFNANCPAGTTATGTMNNLAMVYGTAKNLTKNAFGCSGRTFAGWALNTAGTGDSYDDQESVSNLTTTNGATVNLYAKWRLTPPSPTISGGATKIYGTTATTLTCSENTTYPSGITKYYSFGYATSANGTPSGWTEASTTNTLSIGSTAFIASRYYSCRVYVSNGSEVSDTIVSSNTTNMAINNAKITYNINSCGTLSGTSPSYVNNSMTGVYTGINNTTVGVVPTLSKSGWTFNGWYDGTTKVINSDGTIVASVANWTGSDKKWLITEDKTLKAACVPNYTLTFISDGVTVDTLVRPYGTTIGTLPTITKTGYTFNGWFTDETGGTQISASTPVPNADTSYYAHWTANTYTITLDRQSGSNGTATIYEKYGDGYYLTNTNGTLSNKMSTSANGITVPTKTGHTFGGYYTSTGGGGTQYIDANGKLTSSASSTHFSANGTLYAKWTPSVYTLTANANGGSNPSTSGWSGTGANSTKSVTYGSTYGTLPTPTKSYYTFGGWKKNLINLTASESLPSSTNSANTTLRTFISNTYVKGLAYNNYYNSSAISSVSLTTNTINLKANSGYGIGFPILSSGNQTYTLSFDTNGTANRGYSILYYKSNGTLISYSQQLMTGSHEIKTFTTPADTYYLVPVFYGSNASENIVLTNVQLESGNAATLYESNYITSSTTVNTTANHTISAIWTPTNYSISYNLNGGSVSGNPTSYNIETAAFTLKNPSRTGYTFTGWSGTGLSGSANTSVTVAKGSTGARSYTANWSANSYYLNVNGLLGGVAKGSTEQCGTFDVYTNGTLRANDVNDYNTAWVTGTTYSISDIKAKNGCTYSSVSSGSASGTITGSNVTVQLKYTFAAKNYGYTGGVQSFVAPISGTYKLQVWGAQGGTIGTRKGGLGGYAYGNKALTAGNTIYVVVGQQPPTSTAAGPAAYGGYNGGGNGNGDVQSSIVIGDYARGGGGATHIGGANTNTQLKSVGSSYRNGTYIYIVAGGGGGGGEINNGGAGGAATGGTGGGAYGGTGGTQSAGGQDRGAKCARSKGSFGQGGSACELEALDITRYWAGGGGGGWYGGGAGDWSTSNSSSSYSGGGGGGSNYVGGVSSSSTQQGKRSGSGYATISFVS